MINNQTYYFTSEGRGTLDLQLDKPVKQVYSKTSSISEVLSIKVEGLDSQQPLELLYFFEWQKIQYTYIIDASSNFKAPFELVINNRRENKSNPRNGLHLLTGVFSFNDQVGSTQIEIKDAENKSIFLLKTEVFPQKMDYKSDYKAMMGEISQIIQNLSYASLKDTFSKSRAKLTGRATQTEWWNILDVLFDQMILNLYIINRQPKHDIKRYEVVLPVEKVRQASKKNIEWFRKNGQHCNQDGIGLNVSTKSAFTQALSLKKYVSYDTYENRFIKWSVKNIIEQLRIYKNYITNYSDLLDYSPLLLKLNQYQSRLQSIIHENPFNEVTEFENRSYFSTSLTRGAGYRDFMHIYLLLLRGLEIADNDIFKIEQKDISTLYEYWCFLKLVQILNEQNDSELNYQDLIKVKANKFVVELKKGNESKVTFKNKINNTTTTIYFNKEFGKKGGNVFTFNQRPDYSIEFTKLGFEKSFWYLFDAKYRFDEKSDNEIKFNVPQDAIGQLHRYRDAILHSKLTDAPYRSAVKNLGGIILYPYPLSEKEFKANDFYKSIKEVNIGALPFLPSKTGLVNSLLKDLISKLPEEHFEQFIEMDRSEYSESQNQWSEWITIGTIPKSDIEKRREFISNTNIYHVPFVKNLNSKLYMSKSLLVYDSVSSESKLYQVKDWEINSDLELKQKGVTWDLRSPNYVVFNLIRPKSIQVPTKVGSIKGYRYTTPKGLSRYLETGDKNYFYLTNPSAARFIEEVKLLNKKCSVKWKNHENDPSMIEILIDDLNILSSDIYPPLVFRLGNEPIKLNDLLSKLIKI
ncbi:hypothetical protein SAMN05428947_101286 [Mucilaginibacter sp. OK283]|nr:hypothetical protein SAMN05428947_101286 [Mucilaginibacter sp. OK283]